jgi:hypothetical protein
MRKKVAKLLHWGALALAMLGASAAMAPRPAAAAGRTDCKMRYSLKGWSAFYKVARGQGTITCTNGQKATVRLTAKGGGLTAGKSEIRNGLGKFSEVSSISELFGTYVQANATAAAGKSAGASAMTKGEVSLALSGKGTGIELGVAFGKFTITRK